MGRIARWLLRILEMALLPLFALMKDHAVAVAEGLASMDRRLQMIEVGISDSSASLRATLEAADADQADRDQEQRDAFGELGLAVEAQTRALRAWEDALLGKVQAIADDLGSRQEGAVQLLHEQQDRALSTVPFVAGLARVFTAENIEAAVRIVQNIQGDARLAAIEDPEHRAFQRAKLAAKDLQLAQAGLPLWQAKLLVELAAAQIQGKI